MTPTLLLPLHNAIIGAHRHPDPLLWGEALHRFDVLDQALQELSDQARMDLEELAFRILPSDWPLWQECCRRPADPEGEPTLH